MTQTALVVGASGIVGSAITQLLIENKWAGCRAIEATVAIARRDPRRGRPPRSSFAGTCACGSETYSRPSLPRGHGKPRRPRTFVLMQPWFAMCLPPFDQPRVLST